MTILEALVDPTRMRIVEMLRLGEMDAGAIAAEFETSQPAVSRHLRVLREAGLVQSRVEAQRRVYSLDATPLRELDRWLEPYRRFWEGRLDALDAQVKRARRQRT